MSEQLLDSPPKLRWPLELKLEQLGEDRVLLVKCPLGVAQAPLLLVAAVAPIVVALDGTLSFQQILDRFSPQGLSSDLLAELIATLDQHYCLDNRRYYEARRAFKESYRALPSRVAALAGAAYPADPEALAHLVDAYMQGKSSLVVSSSSHLRVLVAPHIDYRRGGECYGVTYPFLAASSADVYVLIGTSHQYSERLFHLSDKDFKSPLGVARCAKDLVRSIAGRIGESHAYEEEYVHRSEHSLELQLPFFTRIKPNAIIVPVLVGSFHAMLQPHGSVAEWQEYELFVSALSSELQALEKNGMRYTIVAGVDMAHVGRAFGDEGSLTPERMRDIATRDSEYLVAIKERDKNALFKHVAHDKDARRLCGFPTMYTVLDLLERGGRKCDGVVVKYSQAIDYNTDCAVTFAGLLMTDQDL